MTDVLARLRALQAHDVPVTGGRTLAYVYDSGLAEADEVGRAAVAEFAGSNGLDPTAFPSLLAMENELVGRAANLLDAPETAVGTVTSGGTESVLLAVQAARDAHPEIDRPRMVLPVTAHAAFHKAAHYFGVELSANDRASLDPWVFGLIGAVFSGVKRWRSRLEITPDAGAFAHMLAESIWVQIDGMAQMRGIAVPDVPLVELLSVMEQSGS